MVQLRLRDDIAQSDAHDSEPRWPKPKRNRLGNLSGKRTISAKSNGNSFAGSSKRAMPFKATGHKGGISFR